MTVAAIKNNEARTATSDASPRERELVELIHQALDAWPNRRWLVLPGPTDIGNDLARHLAKELASAEAAQTKVRPGARKTPRRQSRGDLTPPCDHSRDYIGTVGAGDFRTGPHCSVSTCGPCANRSAGYVELMTGEKAEPLLTFVEARRRQREQRELERPE